MSDTKFVGTETRNAPLEELGATSAPPPVAAPDALLGKMIDGRYLVESVLGQGGMGLVYRGRHKMIDKRVAIKVLRGEMQNDSEVAQRFLQEARAASAIGNQHIIDISDFGVLPDGATYFVMELLEGASLGSVMESQRPLPISRIIKIAKQIAQGLGAAHTAGIIHRDLKPDNVMLIARGNEKDFVKILDFGIAKVGGESAKLTRAGSVFGTPHYMSPEQAAGAPVASSTDIYSLGVMLYEMAAGKVPFDAENFMGILTMHMYKAPVPMRALVPAPQEIPPGLDAVVLKCLSKKPEARYPTMEALVKDLEALENGGMPDAVNEMMARSGGFNVPADYFRSSNMPPPVPATPSGGRSRSRLPIIAGVAGVVTAIAIVVAIFAKSSTTEARPDANGTPTATATTSGVTTVTSAATTAAPPPGKRAVLLATVEPRDAKVTQDGKELALPVNLELAEGETVNISVARAGFVTQVVPISGKDSRIDVKLVPDGKPVATNGTHATGTASTKPTTTKPNGTVPNYTGTGLMDPDPFATPKK